MVRGRWDSERALKDVQYTLCMANQDSGPLENEHLVPGEFRCVLHPLPYDTSFLG